MKITVKELCAIVLLSIVMGVCLGLELALFVNKIIKAVL